MTVLRNRKYFKSIYFREPGQVIFEMATEAPGLLVDESKEELGKQLQLPQNTNDIANKLKRSCLE
ncbi:hypothetical protein [Streptococcus pluranimalium]|uniref:Ring-cleaving dioxygenase MhqO n=1 Tax=Streptococcus pluranimalium TaxID=82348 RepID=A0A345VKD1_9STRE|nr:Putative ring-cleaving dioxygenase MhqO [Streptococcus pluranimalium]